MRSQLTGPEVLALIILVGQCYVLGGQVNDCTPPKELVGIGCQIDCKAFLDWTAVERVEWNGDHIFDTFNNKSVPVIITGSPASKWRALKEWKPSLLTKSKSLLRVNKAPDGMISYHDEDALFHATLGGCRPLF